MSGSGESVSGRRGPVVSLFLNQPVYFDGSRYTSPYAQPFDLWSGIASEAGELRLCVPMQRTEGARGRVELAVPDGVTMVGLPFYDGEMQLVRMLPYFAWATRRVARREAERADIVGYVAPGIAGLLFSRAARTKPQFEVVRGAKTESVRRIYERGPARLLLGGGGGLLERLAARHRRRYRPVTFVYGRSLVDGMADGGSRAVVEISDGVPEWIANAPPAPERVAPGDAPLRLLYVGRLSREKGVDVLLEAVAGLPGGLLDKLGVDIVGDGPIDGELRELAARLEIEERVRFQGVAAPGPELLAHYDGADVLVLPSRTEGVPRVLLEAMSRGLPVVATSVGGVPWLVPDEECGLIVPPDDAEALGYAIGRVAGDAELRGQLGAAGSEAAREHTLARHRAVIAAALREAYPVVMGGRV